MITPTIDELQECSNEDEVKAVNTPAEGGLVTYPGSASFLPAPWLRDTVISSGTSNYTKLIAEVNAAAFEFDAEHEEDENYITTAAVHAANFILWAWGAGNGLATATKMTFDPNDKDLEQFIENMSSNNYFIKFEFIQKINLIFFALIIVISI